MKKNFIPWWMRIKIHVLLFGVAMSILPIFFLGYLSFTAVRQHLEKNVHEHNYNEVIVLASEMRSLVKTIENNLSYLSSVNSESLVGKDEKARKIILGTLLRQDFVEEIKIADRNYKVIDHVAHREVVLPPTNLTKIENIVAPDQLSSISQVFFSKDNRPQFYLTVVVQDPISRNRIGYLQAKVDLKGITNKFLNLGQGQEGGYIYLVDQNGKLIGHTDFSLVLRQEPVFQNTLVQDFLDGKNFTVENEHTRPDGIKVVGSFAAVGTPNWAVFIEQPATEAYRPIYDFSIRLLMIAILIMVIGIILSIAFGLKLVHPIENLEAQVRRIISKGNLDAHIPIESWDEIGRLVQSFNQLLNILDEKNEKLKDEKELLTTVVDGIGAGMILLNSEKKIIWWNNIFADWFGNELANLPCEQVLKGEGGSFLLENGGVVSVNVAGERRNLRQMYYELNPDNPENAVYLLLLEDVTKKVEIEARMIETDKMAALGLLASGVAHEINNPLAIAAAHSEDLLDRLQEEEPGPSTGEIKKGYKVILEQIVRCKQITDRLLGFARKRVERSDFVDIGVSSLQTLGLLVHRSKQKNVTIESEIEPNLFVLGNENEWQQVVLNILTNAFDASYEGGVIQIKGCSEGDKVLFTVRDFGQGISRHNLKNVFDPFFTTKPSGQGTGLGLFVSYGIVQKMQGELILESVEGQGTSVKIILPSHKPKE